MIYGIGIDTIEVRRVESLLQKQEGTKENLFSPKEIEYCDSKKNWAQSFAARYAAKEAFLKALGTGMNPVFPLTEIQIINRQGGQPRLVLSGRARKVCQKNGIKKAKVSLSHLKQLACAIVILER
jgi:holo-[acyl-carrier protein] synthase